MIIYNQASIMNSICNSKHQSNSNFKVTNKIASANFDMKFLKDLLDMGFK